MLIDVRNTEFLLFPERAIFWPEKQILLMADLHLGKVNHFRKNGIAVPTKANNKNFELIISLIQTTNPLRLIFLGDLFHSHYNEEWEMLRQLIQAFPQTSFELVIGNHDILSFQQYERSNIVIHHNTWVEPPFILSHHPMEEVPDKLYNLAGHIHPGIQLSGRGKQAITLPCYYFGETQGILPAFGSFTGMARIRPKKNDQIYVIVDNSIVKV